MKWYKASESLPKSGEDVLVAWFDDEGYSADCLVAAIFTKFEGQPMWLHTYGNKRVKNTDRWAYIELPKE